MSDVDTVLEKFCQGTVLTFEKKVTKVPLYTGVEYLVHDANKTVIKILISQSASVSTLNQYDYIEIKFPYQSANEAFSIRKRNLISKAMKVFQKPMQRDYIIEHPSVSSVFFDSVVELLEKISNVPKKNLRTELLENQFYFRVEMHYGGLTPAVILPILGLVRPLYAKNNF